MKDSSPMILANPKSASLTDKFLSASRMFSGLMSRWTMLRSCCTCKFELSQGARLTHKVLNPLEQLHEHLARLRLGQFLFHHYPVEQFTLCSKFENEVHSVCFVEGVLEAKQCRVTDSHEYRNFLLEAINLRFLSRPSTLLELLHSIPYAAVLLYAEIDRSEVTFAQLLLYSVLLSEAICNTMRWVSENKACNVKYTDLISLLQLPSLVSADDCVVDIGAIA